MNKKLIRLTEQDLHRMVKESVNEVIKQMKIDPRSWAIKSDEYRQQGRDDDANYAKDRAIDAWNRLYGGSGYRNGIGNRLQGNNTYYDIKMGKQRDSNDYTLHNQEHREKGESHECPSDFYNLNHEDENLYWKGDGSREYSDKPTLKKPKGYDIAKQMAQGNGVYDKNRGGWQ